MGGPTIPQNLQEQVWPRTPATAQPSKVLGEGDGGGGAVFESYSPIRLIFNPKVELANGDDAASRKRERQEGKKPLILFYSLKNKNPKKVQCDYQPNKKKIEF